MRLERGDLTVIVDDGDPSAMIVRGETLEEGVDLTADDLAWLLTAALPAAIVAMRPAPESVRPVASPIDGQLPLG